MKISHQQGANLNDSNQNVEVISVEKIIYRQNGNFHLEFDITVQNPAGKFDNNSEIRLVNNGFAYCFKEASVALTGGGEIEYVKNVGQVSTIMRSLTSKDGDLLSHFKDFNAMEIQMLQLIIHPQKDAH